MVFEKTFDTITNQLDKKRDELISRQIESETQKLNNAWNEAANLHRLEEEQNDRIGSGFTESETKWYDEEYRNVLNSIKDKRIKDRFETHASSLKANFTISAKKQEVDFLKKKELQDTGTDINYKLGQIASQSQIGELDQSFQTLLLPQINSKLDSIQDPDQKALYKQQTDAVFAGYVDQKILLYKDQVNRGTLTEKDYQTKIDELQDYVSNEPEFYRNISNRTFTGIVSGLNGLKAESSKEYKQIRQAAYADDLPGVKKQSQEQAQPLTEEFIQEGIALADPTKKRELEIDLRAHNATIPYFQARKEANVQLVAAEYAKLYNDLEDQLNGNVSGLELEKAQVAFQAVQADYKELNDLVENKFTDFALKNPEVAFYHELMTKDPRRKGEFVKALISVGQENQKDARLLEFLPDAQATKYANALSAEGVQAEEVQDTLIKLINEWNVPYESNNGKFNVANNVLNQVIAKAGSKKGVAFQYYDSEYFNVIYDASNFQINKEESDKRGFDSNDVTSINKIIDQKFGTFFRSIQTVDSTNAPAQIQGYKDIALGIVMLTEFGGFKDKKGRFINSREAGVNFAKEVLIDSAYVTVNNEGQNKNIRVPKNVFGKDYSAAAPIIADSGFKESALEWLRARNPQLTLDGDISDQLLLPASVRALRGEINAQKLVDDVFFGNSEDGLGVQMFTYFNGRPEPVVFKDGGPAYIPFEQIIEHRAFISPFRIRQDQSRGKIGRTQASMKIAEERKIVKDQMKFEQATFTGKAPAASRATFTNVDLNNFKLTNAEEIRLKEIEREAEALTSQSRAASQSINSLNGELNADLDRSRALIQDILDQ